MGFVAVGQVDVPDGSCSHTQVGSSTPNPGTGSACSRPSEALGKRRGSAWGPYLGAQPPPPTQARLGGTCPHLTQSRLPHSALGGAERVGLKLEVLQSWTPARDSLEPGGQG